MRVIILVATFIALVSGEYEELCSRFADNVKLREPGNCNAYVTCVNGTGTVTACPDNQLYDKENSKCVATLSDSYCKARCDGKDQIWVADQTNCNGYYYCNAGEAIYGICHSGYYFTESTQTCDYSTDSSCHTVSDFCGIVKNNVNFQDPDNCAGYLVCVKEKLTSKSCSVANTYFDARSGECISKYEVECDAHPLPTNVCTKNKKPIINQFVDDGASCRGYYYCAYKGDNLADPNPSWNQCPEGLFFDADSQACLDPTVVKCSHNRCEGRGTAMVLAENEFCQHYHVCIEHRDTGLLKCPRGMFFKESLQSCVYEELSYPICDDV